MATKAKRTPAKPARAAKTSSRAPKTKSKAKAAVAKKPSTSRKIASKEFWLRTRFIFFTVLIAAALVSISLGLMSYQTNKRATYAIRATNENGVFFLQSLDSDGTHKAGETIDVTLYEDSGKQEINALQAAVRYPSEKLEFVSVKSGLAFPQEAATDTSNPGLIRVARSINPGDASVKGAKPVVTFQFKVLVDSDQPFELTIDDTASLLVRSIDNQNILGTNSVTKFEL